jgi:hypothetical protein
MKKKNKKKGQMSRARFELATLGCLFSKQSYCV